jgi:hypothetical protein
VTHFGNGVEFLTSVQLRKNKMVTPELTNDRYLAGVPEINIPLPGARFVAGELMKSEQVYFHSTYVSATVYFRLESCVLNAVRLVPPPAPYLHPGVSTSCGAMRG